MIIWLIGNGKPAKEWASPLDSLQQEVITVEASEPFPEVKPDGVLICLAQQESVLKLCQKLRRNTAFEDVPILILSNAAEKLNQADLYTAGADDVLERAEASSLGDRIHRHHLKFKKIQHLQNALAEEKKKSTELEIKDNLTGLGNRKSLRQFIEKDLVVTLRAYRSWERMPEDSNPADDDLAFLFLEIDHFRYLNDQYGQKFGDDILLAVRNCLVDVFRETDTVIRWGGKTFLIVSRKANRDSAGRLAERARIAINQCVLKPNEETDIQLSASIGICFYPFLQSRPDVFGWEEIINVARLARDSAKASGRNAWVSLNAASSHESTLDYTSVMASTIRNITVGALQVSTSFPDYHTLTWPRRQD